MKVSINISLDEYVERGDRNTKGMLAGHHNLMPDVRVFYDFFATKLWSEGQPIPQIPMFLSTNAVMTWTSAVRMAMSGHEAAVYPLLRTALESACYAHLINNKPDLAPVWSSRHDGSDQLKAARKAFRTAVSDTTEAIKIDDPHLAGLIASLYEASIDLGAHPNALGIMNHVRTAPPTDDETQFDQGSIYPGDSFQAYRALAAAIEFGLGIAVLLARCLPILSQTVGSGLQDLANRRMALVRSGKSGGPPGERE